MRTGLSTITNNRLLCRQTCGFFQKHLLLWWRSSHVLFSHYMRVLLHNSPTEVLFYKKGNKGPPALKGRPLCKRCLQVLRALAAAVVAPVLLEHVVIAPKVWLYRAVCGVFAAERSPFALQVEVVPKLKLHLWHFPGRWYQPRHWIRIGDGFFQLVRDDVRHAVDSAHA